MTHATPTHFPLVPSVNGDYIWVCADCDHALSGFDPAETGWLPDGYRRETLEGALYILTHMTPGEVLKPLPSPDDRSDSNLLSICSCCFRPHETFEWYSGYQAVKVGE